MPPKKAKQDEEEWEVEHVLDRKKQPDGSFLFLTKWKDCPPSENTWEPRSSFGSNAWQVRDLENFLAGKFKKPQWLLDYERSRQGTTDTNGGTTSKDVSTNQKDSKKKPAKTPEKKKGRPPKKTPAAKPPVAKSAPVASPAYIRLDVAQPRRRTQAGDGPGITAAAAAAAASPRTMTQRKRTRSTDASGDRDAAGASSTPRRGASSDGPRKYVTTPPQGQGAQSPSNGLQISTTGATGHVAGSRSPVNRESYRREIMRGLEGESDDDDLLEESLSSPESMVDEEVDETTLSMSSHQSPSAIANGPSSIDTMDSAENGVITHRPASSASLANGPSTSGMTEPPRFDPTMVSSSPDARPAVHTTPKKDKHVKLPVTPRPTMVGMPPMNSSGGLRGTARGKKRAHDESQSSDPEYDAAVEERRARQRRPRRRTASAVVLPEAMDNVDEDERDLRASGRIVAFTTVSLDYDPIRVVWQETGSNSVFFNTKCAVGPNCHRSLFSALPKQIEGLRLSQLWQSVLIRLVECSREQKLLLEAVLEHHREPPQFPTVTVSFAWGGCTRALFLAPPSDHQEANNKISAILTTVGMCGNAIRFGTQLVCNRCEGQENQENR